MSRNKKAEREKFLKKLYAFARFFEKHHNKRLKRLNPKAPTEKIGVEESGYKFCKVFFCGGGYKGR